MMPILSAIVNVKKQHENMRTASIGLQFIFIRNDRTFCTTQVWFELSDVRTCSVHLCNIY